MEPFIKHPNIFFHFQTVRILFEIHLPMGAGRRRPARPPRRVEPDDFLVDEGVQHVDVLARPQKGELSSILTPTVLFTFRQKTSEPEKNSISESKAQAV